MARLDRKEGNGLSYRGVVKYGNSNDIAKEETDVHIAAILKESRFSVRKYAGKMGMSVRQLERLFQSRIGLAPKQWLLQRRMSMARDLLLNGKPIKVIVDDLGYKDRTHFCHAYKRYYGVNASDA